MSNTNDPTIINIDSLSKKFENSLELKLYCDAQYLLLQKQTAQITQLQAEIAHLKDLLSKTPLTDDQSSKFVASVEQTICEMEIERLKETAMNRGLTLEETKRLDLLVKNLFLAKEQKKDNQTSFKSFAGISNEKLIE